MSDEQPTLSRSDSPRHRRGWCVHEPDRLCPILLETQDSKNRSSGNRRSLRLRIHGAKSDKFPENLGQSAASSLYPISDEGRATKRKQPIIVTTVPDDLCQATDGMHRCRDDETADHQTQPSCIGDLEGHFEAIITTQESVESRGSRIQQQQSKAVIRSRSRTCLTKSQVQRAGEKERGQQQTLGKGNDQSQRGPENTVVLAIFASFVSATMGQTCPLTTATGEGKHTHAANHSDRA